MHGNDLVRNCMRGNYNGEKGGNFDKGRMKNRRPHWTLRDRGRSSSSEVYVHRGACYCKEVLGRICSGP